MHLDKIGNNAGFKITLKELSPDALKTAIVTLPKHASLIYLILTSYLQTNQNIFITLKDIRSQFVIPYADIRDNLKLLEKKKFITY